MLFNTQLRILFDILIDKQFFGLDLYTKEPFYLPFEDSTHLLYVGATRSAKGVALAHRVVEAMRQTAGVIVIDPKKDDFLPQIIKEELERQNRSDDLLIASYPNNFAYSGFNSDDTYLELANKLTVALDLAPTGDPKSDYYRRNERTLLKQICKFFLNSKELLNVKFELNYKSLLNFIKYLLSDLNNAQNYTKEQAKNKPNFDLIEQYSKRYFDVDLFAKLELNFDDVATLKGLYQTIEELTDANIFTSINIEDALYNSKIVYIQADQLDVASLKMLKILQVDIIQKAKKKTANCIVIADEVSFYATKTLADSLSTIAGFGVRYILAMQDLAQLNDDLIKKPILSNCQTKLFYKSSDIETLEYIEKISGKELVTQMSKQNNVVTIRQTQEEYLNITRLRAIKRDRVAILIAESLASPIITQTWHIEVAQKFDWSLYETTMFQSKHTKLKKEFQVKCNNDDEDNNSSTTNDIINLQV
jgi:type IV secretion system protein VirD4